jgi:hypothetical protein
MSDAEKRLPPKKEVALALLQGPSLFIHLDPRRSGVIVPKWLTGQPQLVLQVGLNMAIQIPDLTVDDDGVSCTLSFNRSPFWCQLPWSAVYALVGEDGRGMIWPNDVPPEIALQMQKGAGAAPGQPAAAKPAPAAKKGKTKLSAVADAPPKSPRPRPRAEPKPVEEAEAPEAKPVEAERPRPKRVPAPALAAPARAEATEGEGEAAPSSPPASAPTSEGAPRKPRRELPPYLRVVK